MAHIRKTSRVTRSQEEDRNGSTRARDAVLTGSSICPGIGVGVVRWTDPVRDIPRTAVTAGQVRAEQRRYRDAVESLRKDLRERIRQFHGDRESETPSILEVHEVMLRDETFHSAVVERIAAEHRNVEWALEEEGRRMTREFEKARTAYLQARAEDVRDLVDHLLSALDGQEQPLWHEPPEGGRYILASGSLYPSDTVLAERIGAKGFATESRALTSHGALMLKGFGIPAVGALAGLRDAALEGDALIVDGNAGKVIIRPSPELVSRYERQAQEPASVQAAALRPYGTANGVRVRLLANIEQPQQAALAWRSGLEGIGLFRTEFLVLLRDDVPSEEEQYAVYRDVVQGAEGRPVTFRTFDLGADKQSPFMARCTGQNPALGVRGIRRHLLQEPGELQTQMRAILRAAVDADVRILMPLVTTPSDARRGLEHLEAAAKSLEARGTPYNPGVQLGAMIECPAAAIETRAILEITGFISVGTNDLLQYLMAADRDNEQVLGYNDPMSPAFTFLMRHIIDKAKDLNRVDDVTVCGEAAARPDMLPSLLRLGYRSFSIPSVSVQAVSQALAETQLET